MSKPIIKLFTLYALRLQYDNRYYDNIICNGIWQSESVEEADNGRIYTLACIAPNSDKVRIGERRIMPEEVIIAMCDKIEIVRKPLL